MRCQPLGDGPAQIGVKAYLFQVVDLCRLLDGVFHIVVVDGISIAEPKESGTGPVPVWDVIPFLRFQDCAARTPDGGQQHRRVKPWLRREQQNKRRHIPAGGEVNSTVADFPAKLFQELLPLRLLAGSPLALVVQRQ